MSNHSPAEAAAVALGLAIINLIVIVVGCSFLLYALALRRNRRGTAICVFAIILCGQVWLLPAILSGLLFTGDPRSVPFWFGDWLITIFAILITSHSRTPISRDSIDAARLDGCGPVRTCWHVVLPAMAPTLVAVALFAVVATLQEFIRPLLYLIDQRLVLLSFGLEPLHAPVALSGHNPPLATMIALSCLMTLPLIAVFFVAQRPSFRGAMLAEMDARSR